MPHSRPELPSWRPGSSAPTEPQHVGRTSDRSMECLRACLVFGGKEWHAASTSRALRGPARPRTDRGGCPDAGRTRDRRGLPRRHRQGGSRRRTHDERAPVRRTHPPRMAVHQADAHAHHHPLDHQRGDGRVHRRLGGGRGRSVDEQGPGRRTPAAVAGRPAQRRRGVRHHRGGGRRPHDRGAAQDRARPPADLVRHRRPRIPRRLGDPALLRGLHPPQHQPEPARGDGRTGGTPVAQVPQPRPGRGCRVPRLPGQRDDREPPARGADRGR